MLSLKCPHCKGLLPPADVEAGDLIACLNCKRLGFAQAAFVCMELPLRGPLPSADGVFSGRAPAMAPCPARAAWGMEDIPDIALFARRANPRIPWKKIRLVSICSVMAIAAFLLIQVLRGMHDSRENQKIGNAKTSAGLISTACDMYFLDHQQYPPNLQALLIKDGDGKGPYLKNRDELLDPWGNVFQYDATGILQPCIGACTHVPDVFCVLPDGRMIGNWK
jgi:general secretion pathway protein G